MLPMHMRENVINIQANPDEITFYCFLGEALCKIQLVEQALSHSITLKMYPEETKEEADEFLKKHQSYTLGTAIKTAREKMLYSLSIQDELTAFLKQRNWLVHNVILENQNDLLAENKKFDLFNRIKSISVKAESIQREIEYDMIKFCSSMGKDMSEILKLLKSQERGMRIQK